MQCRLIILAIFSFFLMSSISSAGSSTTTRTAQFSNDKVSVWETVVYPGANQVLKMHSHEHDRVIVALSDGLLKITNDNGKIHYLKLEKNKAYYLTKDIPNELHNDQNMSPHPVKVLVVVLKNNPDEAFSHRGLIGRGVGWVDPGRISGGNPTFKMIK